MRGFARIPLFLGPLLFLAAVSPAFAQSVSISIQNLTPGDVVSAGTTVSFGVIAAGFTNPTYTLSDSFGGSSISSSDINSSGTFAWTPTSSDQGVHDITVTAQDSEGHTGEISVQITVASSYITVGTVTPSSSVAAGTTVNFSTSLTGFTNPSFALNDSFSGGSLTSSDINSSGFFTWTPTQADAGTHTITVLAFDSSGHSASASVTITVSAGADVTLGSVFPSTSVSPGTLVSFDASADNFNDPSFNVTDNFSGTTISSGDISSSGGFTWTPQESDIGTHTLTVSAYDSEGHIGNATVTITVGNGLSSTASTVVPTTLAASTPTSLQPTSGYQFTQYLAPGSENEDVMELQEILAQEGFLTATPTGYYGDATEAAVEAFQTAHGIDPLGVVGPATRAVLNTLQPAAAVSTVSTEASTIASSAGLNSTQQQQITLIEQQIQQIQTELESVLSGN